MYRLYISAALQARLSRADSVEKASSRASLPTYALGRQLFLKHFKVYKGTDQSHTAQQPQIMTLDPPLRPNEHPFNRVRCTGAPRRRKTACTGAVVPGTAVRSPSTAAPVTTTSQLQPSVTLHGVTRPPRHTLALPRAYDLLVDTFKGAAHRPSRILPYKQRCGPVALHLSPDTQAAQDEGHLSREPPRQRAPQVRLKASP